MKQVEVTVYRRVYTTYRVEVPDEFDVDSDQSWSWASNEIFLHGGEDWKVHNLDVDTEEIDAIYERDPVQIAERLLAEQKRREEE